ncbi:MAG: type II toxin-antitoxin system prevent-host-death family antitoxin [Chloroflexota bacterium]
MKDEKKEATSHYQIGVRDLKNQLTKIVSQVREQQQEYIVTVHGQPVAVLRPYTEVDEATIREKAVDQEMADIEALSELVTDAWETTERGKSILEIMREESSWR